MYISEENGVQYLLLEEDDILQNLEYVKREGYFDHRYFLQDGTVKNKYLVVSERYTLNEEVVGTPLAYAFWLKDEFRHHRIIEKYDNQMSGITDKEIGNMLWNTGGFLAVTKEWVLALSQWIGERSVLEIFSGLGVLSCALRQNGVDVISVDNHSYKPFIKQTCWIDDTIEMDALDAIEKFGRDRDFLLCSYPPINGQMKEILYKMRQINPGMRMIYFAPFNSEYTGDDFCLKAEVRADEGLSKVFSLYKDWINYPAFAAEFKLIK